MAYGRGIVEQAREIEMLSNDQLITYVNNPDGRWPLYLVLSRLHTNQALAESAAGARAGERVAQLSDTVRGRLAPPSPADRVPQSSAGLVPPQRFGETSGYPSQVAANPAPQIPLQQAGGAPQMPTFNAQEGFTHDDVVKLSRALSKAEKKGVDALGFREGLEYFGKDREKGGSFREGGNPQPPESELAALRRFLLEKKRGWVDKGRQTRGAYMPKGTRKGFTGAARHARTQKGNADNSLELAMAGLAGLNKNKKRPTVYAQDGYQNNPRWTPAGSAGAMERARMLAGESPRGLLGDPRGWPGGDTAPLGRGRLVPPPSVGFPFQRSADISVTAAIEADPNLVLGETADAQRMIKILEMTPEGRKRLEIARDIVSGSVGKPEQPPLVPIKRQTSWPVAAYPPGQDPESLEFIAEQADKAEGVRLEEAAEQAEEYKRQRATGAANLAELREVATKRFAMEGGPAPDFSQLEKNIQKWNDDLLLLQGKLPTPQTAEQRMATHNKWVKPTRDAQYKSLREAIGTQGKASQEHIKSVENAGEAIKEFARTGKLPEGRRDALSNKLLLTWGAALLGNPTLADAMSQGFAASIDVIEGEQKNYAKALTDELQAVKAVGELKMKAADSEAAALRNIASARAADAKQDQQMSVKFMEMANKDIATLMTHKRGMLTLSYQALTARVALLNARKPNAATNQLKALNQAIRTEFGAYIADYDKALKKAEKDGTSPKNATDKVNADYSTRFGMNKSGVLDANAWKPNAPKFAAAARMMQPSGSSTAIENLGLKYGTMTMKATALVNKRDPAMGSDPTTVAVLESMAGETVTWPPDPKANFAAILKKHSAEIRRNFSKLYRARKKWEETGRRGPDPVGRGGGGAGWTAVENKK